MSQNEIPKLQLDDTPRIMSKKKIFLLLGAALAIAIGLAVLVAIVIDPTHKGQGAEALQKAIAETGTIRATNFNAQPYSQGGLTATKGQLALAQGSNVSAPGEFDFANGKTTSSNERNTLTVYLDPATRASQQFYFLEENYLKSLVDFGTLKLQLIMVPSTSPISIYGGELLAEATHQSPTSSWNVLSKIMAASEADANLKPTVSQVLTLLTSDISSLDLKNVTEETLAKGPYANWFYQASKAPVVQGQNLPLIELNGKMIVTSAKNFFSSNGLETYIQAHLA